MSAISAEASGRVPVTRTTGELIEIEQEVSLRLLRHLASSVRHQQYYDSDIVTVRVDRPSA